MDRTIVSRQDHTSEMPEPTLFGSLPSQLFRLLAGSNRWLFADLLEYLDREVFAAAGEVLSKRQIVESIREFLERGGRSVDLEGADLAEVEGDQDKAPFFIYYRLVETGWLIEFRDRYRRIVDMNANARLVLAVLLDIKAGRTRSYGGEVVQTLSLLGTAKRDPENQSVAIRNAARSAKSFMHHLRTVSGAVRQIEDDLVRQTDLRTLFRKYFDDFVEKYLVEDFKHLRSSTNPFRFRQRIIDQVGDILADEPLLRALADAYVKERRAESPERARQIIGEELAEVSGVFEWIEDYIELIENTNQRLEQRISNTVRFLDRIAEARTEKVMHAFRLLGQTKLPLDAELEVPHGLITASAILGQDNLYQQKARAGAAEPQPIRRHDPDPAFLAYRAALDAYRARTNVTPQKIAAYLDRAMIGRDEIGASELPLESLDDFFVFERLRTLPWLSDGALAPFYAVELRHGELIENDWISCTDFHVRRKKRLTHA